MQWDEFLKATANKFTRPLLKEALPYVKHADCALDLGAGAMNDASYLVRNGFNVIAVDSNDEVAKYARDIPNTEFVNKKYEEYSFPVEHFDLVNAQYALPFMSPEHFNDVFSSLILSLKKGGIFTGQFFGTEDGWAETKTMTFHTEEQVKDLLNPLTVLVFKEEKKLGKTAVGKEKFWHVFDVIAEKRD